MSEVDVGIIRKAVTASKSIEPLLDDKPSEITEANKVKIGDEIFDTTSKTNFYNEDQQQDLKAVIFCWIHDKSSVVDYKNECTKYGIPDFKFLVKTELNTWLTGNSDSCKFVKTKGDEGVNGETIDGDGSGPASKKQKIQDPQIDRIDQFELESIDHNAILRGAKNIDFGYLIKDSKSLIHQLKRNKPSKSRNHEKSLKLPIIIISPATTSLLSLSNVKEFLENSKFIDPNSPELKRPEENVVVIKHESERLHPSAHKITVVDNVDAFTKPEYWDRVVAIFTTGQAWQFSKYKYSNPESLFQRYAGFYLSYQSDITPKQIKDWNVNEIKVDRDKRFRDKLVVKDFWSDLEKLLIAMGYGR